MAIAAVPDIRTLEVEPLVPDHLDLPWPRPALRLVGDVAACPDRREAPAPPPVCLPAVRRGAEVRRRPLAALPSQRVRRRRVVAALIVAGLLGLLTLPLSALGGRPVPARPTAAAPAGWIAYVVQPGDTLWSIATRFGPGDPRALAGELAAQTGSATVHPGEQIHVP